MSAPSTRYELDRRGHSPSGGSERASSDNRLEQYVTANISRLDRIFSKEQSATGLADDTRNMLSWWSEFKTLRGMYAPEGRLAQALATRSFRPLFADMITAEQAARLEAEFTKHYAHIDALAQRFLQGPGTLEANKSFAAEVSSAKAEMLALVSELSDRKPPVR